MERISPEVKETPEVGSLARGRLGTWGIVFLVFAAMTPLVGLTSITGLAMSLGSGIGIVGLYQFCSETHISPKGNRAVSLHWDKENIVLNK